MLNVDRLERLLATTFTVGRSGRELVIACPLCGDSKLRLYISMEHGRWLCFHCQEKGHLGQLLTKVAGLDETTARMMERRIHTGSHRPGMTVTQPEETKRPELMTQVIPPPGFLSFARYWNDGIAQPYRDYLAGRGVDQATAVRHDMGFVMLGAYAGRLIIPVHTEGVVKTWLARAVLPDLEPKILNCPGSGAATAMFNIDNLSPPWVVLVEGVFDALNLPGLAAATLGARVSRWQRRYLKQRGFTRVVLLRDSDETGKESAVRDALELVASGFSVYIAQLPIGVADPGEASKDDLSWALANAQPVEDIVGIEVLKEVHNA